MAKVLAFIVSELPGVIKGTQTAKNVGRFRVVTCDETELGTLQSLNPKMSVLTAPKGEPGAKGEAGAPGAPGAAAPVVP